VPYPHKHTPRQNRLLAALPLVDYERLLPDLEPVSLPLGGTVHSASDREKYLFFLTAGIVSKFYVTESGASTGFAVTGSEGVTEAAGKLQKAGLIHYSRGRIAVLDRPKLEAQACECYAVVKREYSRLIPNIGEPKSLLRVAPTRLASIGAIG
jgi:hypothetical protein